MEPPHAGAANPPKDSLPPHPAPQQKDEAYGASAYHRSGSLPPNPAYEEFQREYAARYAAYSDPVVSRRRRGFRAIHMALIFTLGAAAGLGGAWWADSSGGDPTAASPVPGIVASNPVLPSNEQLIRRDSGEGVRGIRSSELPYDGKPPDESEQTASAPPVAPITSAALSSGSSDEDEGGTSALPANSSASVSAPAAEPARKSSSSTEAAKEAPVLASRAAGPADTRSREAESKAAGSAATTPKRTAVAKNAKEQEIERIRRQADDELKKKNDAARRAGGGRNTSRVAQNDKSGTQLANLASSSSQRAKLAQCEAAPNIFLREQCKWKLCNGMWGKNGCPSYAKPNSFYKY